MRSFVLVLCLLPGLTRVAFADPPPVEDPHPASPTEDALHRRVEELERRLDAAESVARAQPPTGSPPEERRSPFALRLQGYGDIQLSFHDYGLNQNREGGAQEDRRLVFDVTRFVLEVEGEMPYGIEFEGEIEIEHGGAGIWMSLEYEEFGEFEEEVKKGGEVMLEELFLAKVFGEHYRLAIGRFYVAMGLLPHHEYPTQYLGSVRSEAETTVLPGVWDEIGLSFEARFPRLTLTAQLVNGLDSTGFDSQRWVSGGQQGRFPTIRATDLAGVLRTDLRPWDGVELGAAAYFGGTSRNRPKADLVRDCADANPAVVAPCGYVGARVLMLQAHARVDVGPIRAQALVLWGHLWNAAAVSSRNERLSNALGVRRTAVADEAFAAWGEIGLDVAPWLGVGADHRFEPFVRVDYYDTMFRPREGLFDNPRFERTVVSGGLAYTLSEALTLKLDASHRRFGTSALRPENTVRLAAGFVY